MKSLIKENYKTVEMKYYVLVKSRHETKLHKKTAKSNLKCGCDERIGLSNVNDKKLAQQLIIKEINTLFKTT